MNKKTIYFHCFRVMFVLLDRLQFFSFTSVSIFLSPAFRKKKSKWESEKWKNKKRINFHSSFHASFSLFLSLHPELTFRYYKFTLRSSTLVAQQKIPRLRTSCCHLPHSSVSPRQRGVSSGSVKLFPGFSFILRLVFPSP